MDTADLIKGWRNAAGLTRMQLAGRIDRYVASVSGWERGATCSAETVAAIGRACGVPDLQRLEAVAQAAGEGEGWARLRAVLGPSVASLGAATSREIEGFCRGWCRAQGLDPDRWGTYAGIPVPAELVKRRAEAEETMARAGEDREIEADAERIYNEWCSVADFRPWVPGGNSHKQDEARALARARRGTP